MNKKEKRINMATEKKTKKTLVPRSKNQADYIRTISENDVTLCSGPAGSGKSMIAVGMACEYLELKKVEKIIVTRPVIESGRGMGYLPGTMLEKIQPYLVPILEEMEMFLGKDSLKYYRDTNQIEICPLEFMRGRNFHNSFMILDEAQNATIEQIKMFITRIGRDSKAVLNGDVRQSDLPEYTQASFEKCINNLGEVEGVGIMQLRATDIVRNPIIASVLSRLNDVR